LVTLAIRQRTARITFDSAAEMLDTFGIQQGGSQYRRLVDSFQRIFGATIFFGTDIQKDRAAVVHRARFNFMAEARIWYSRDPEHKSLPGDCQNVVVLSEEFYKEISSHPIPADLEAAKALSASPAASTCSCGSPIDASPPAGGSACHYSASTDLFANSAAPTGPAKNVIGAVKFAGNEPPVPGEDSIRFGDTGDLLKCRPAEPLADFSQGGSLGIGKAHSGWKMGSENPILGCEGLGCGAVRHQNSHDLSVVAHSSHAIMHRLRF
jgi:hypothetical protein